MLYEYLLLSQPLFSAKMSFEERMDEACQGQELPGVVLAADGPGGFHYQRAFGKRSLKGKKSEEPLDVDATFSLASCTKLMTTIAALQCVERGLLRLDEDVTSVLPELKDIKILTGYDQRTQTPILVRRRNNITLRHLLTHTSGISHPAWNYCLYEYLTSQNRPVSLTGTGRISNTCRYPLVFEPGTSWEYGAGLDWAGKMVERVNSNISLQQYMQANIWTPLNIRTATFRLNERPDLKAKVPKMMYRQGLNHPTYGTTMNPSGRLVPALDSEEKLTSTVQELPDDDDLNHPDMIRDGNDDFGGSGAYSSAPDFAKILRSLCTNDAQLLCPASVDEMFRPQLSPAAQARLQSFFTDRHVNNIFAGGLPLATSPGGFVPLDWGLGGLLVLDDVPSDSVSSSSLSSPSPVPLSSSGRRMVSRRRRGAMFWAGLPNLFWWMDPRSEVSGFYASQLLPQGDPRSVEYLARFEEWVYEKVGVEA